MFYRRYVATRAVTTRVGKVQDDKHQDQDEGDDPKDFHPAWYAGGRSVVRPRM